MEESWCSLSLFAIDFLLLCALRSLVGLGSCPFPEAEQRILIVIPLATSSRDHLLSPEMEEEGDTNSDWPAGALLSGALQTKT